MNEMTPCLFAPKRAKGAHSLSVVIPPDTDHDMILFCDRCGATKREALSTPGPLDAESAERILASVRVTNT